MLEKIWTIVRKTEGGVEVEAVANASDAEKF